MNDTTDDRVWSVAERVTRVETLLEAHAKESHAFREASNARMDRLDEKMGKMDSKIDTMLGKIAAAETVVGAGGGLIKWLGGQVPAAGVGGLLSWLATHLWVK